MSFAREGWPFVLPFFGIAFALYLTGQPRWALLLLVLGLAVLLFFRNPDRRFAGPDSIVLAAADGVVTLVEELEEPTVGPGRFHHVVTFLSVFDVHVQRNPVAGRVIFSELVRGAKVAAFRPDAGTVNEQHRTVFELANGDRVGVRQIAGLFARRVVCYLGTGETVERGALLGVIKFGSRVDLYIPASYRLRVKKGDRMRNGETQVAEAPPADRETSP